MFVKSRSIARVALIVLSLTAFSSRTEIGATVSRAATLSAEPDWALNVTLIEACSCPLFCQCFFTPMPAAHHEHGKIEHFCRANIAYRVNKGHYGSLKLDGLKFWASGDLGGDFSAGEGEWLVVTFEKSATGEQRMAIGNIMQQILPFKWKSFSIAEGTIDKWEYTDDVAQASLDGGKTAEIKLRRFPGMTNKPIVIANLKYLGAPRNDGFKLMPNEVEAYRVGPKAFEFRGTNGFVITLDATSKDFRR